jgi:hypothetical protein
MLVRLFMACISCRIWGARQKFCFHHTYTYLWKVSTGPGDNYLRHERDLRPYPGGSRVCAHDGTSATSSR